MASEDIALLMRLLLMKESKNNDVIDPDFQKGFYNFLAVAVLNTIGTLEFDKTLTPHLTSNTELPSSTAFCMDITISLMEKFLMGRLVISSEFLQSWKERYTSRKLNPLSAPRENPTDHSFGSRKDIP